MRVPAGRRFNGNGRTEAARLCPHFPDCPGCPWVDRPYAEQLEAKLARVREALRDTPGEHVVEAIVPAVRQTGYRVQAKHVVARTRSGLTIGLYRPGTHHVADATGCPLHDRLIARTLPVLRDALVRTAAPIHAESGRAGVRYALLLNGSLALAAHLAIGRRWAQAPLPIFEERRQAPTAGL